MSLTLLDQIATPPVERVIDGFIEQYASFGYKLVVFVLTFLGFYLVGRLVAIPLIERALRNQRITPTVRRPTLKAARAGVVIVAFFVGLFAARLQSLFTVTGGLAAAFTLAVGFASRDVLGNLVGGVFIITIRSSISVIGLNGMVVRKAVTRASSKILVSVRPA